MNGKTYKTHKILVSKEEYDDIREALEMKIILATRDVYNRLERYEVAD